MRNVAEGERSSESILSLLNHHPMVAQSQYVGLDRHQVGNHLRALYAYLASAAIFSSFEGLNEYH